MLNVYDAVNVIGYANLLTCKCSGEEVFDNFSLFGARENGENKFEPNS